MKRTLAHTIGQGIISGVVIVGIIYAVDYIDLKMHDRKKNS